MLRGICFCICMSVMLSLFAQNEESNFIAPDRTVHKRSEIIKRAIKKFLNFSDFDTAYISPNRYNYALRILFRRKRYPRTATFAFLTKTT